MCVFIIEHLYCPSVYIFHSQCRKRTALELYHSVSDQSRRRDASLGIVAGQSLGAYRGYRHHCPRAHIRVGIDNAVSSASHSKVLLLHRVCRADRVSVLTTPGGEGTESLPYCWPHMYCLKVSCLSTGPYSVFVVVPYY